MQSKLSGLISKGTIFKRKYVLHRINNLPADQREFFAHPRLATTVHNTIVITGVLRSFGNNLDRTILVFLTVTGQIFTHFSNNFVKE